MNRRTALASLGASLAVLAGCDTARITAPRPPERLTARPGKPSIDPPRGLSTLPDDAGARGLLYVPPGYNAATAAPVAVLLHGATQDANTLMVPVSAMADGHGLVCLALKSNDIDWDYFIDTEFSVDVAAMDSALRWLFARIATDRRRLTLIGFSDGATYSLALGRANGDLFPRVVAYSPGGLIEIHPQGTPEFFITHGTLDGVLSYENTRDFIVPTLRSDGYSVRFEDFSGGHGVPEDLIADSLDWAVRSA